MSVVPLDSDPIQIDRDEVKFLARRAGISLPESHVGDFATLLGALEQSVQQILGEDDYAPNPDLEKYPRYNIELLQSSEENGWAARCTAKCIAPETDLLKGKRIALKDNIALAEVRCTNGTAAFDWIPDIDATVAKRVMDAGGTITGKATCENMCLGGVSDTSCTGKVHNPYAVNYSAGGSSSGNGMLVATEQVDMAIGCDQGGSIRIPAANCGIVGLKPTWGLVPYTGISSFEATVDHAGPMARRVRDVALLLEAIAGPDGIDDRQPPILPPGMLEYTSQLDSWLSSSEGIKPLTGMKIGVLKEGFTIHNMDSNIRKLCSDAVDRLQAIGATTVDVSVPEHTRAAMLINAYLVIPGGRQGLFQDAMGRKQHYMLDRMAQSQRPMSEDTFDKIGAAGQHWYLRYLYAEEKYGTKLHAKCSNLIRRLNDQYNEVLSNVDVLVMPTLPIPPCKLYDDPSAHSPLERLSRTAGLGGNAISFNATGHPAMTIPVGFVPAQDDASINLPAGLQIVARKFADIDCLKVGTAYERAYDWKNHYAVI